MIASRALPEQALAKLPDLCRQHGVRSLDVFGSAVTDRFDPVRSDLDFLVRFEDRPVSGSARLWFDFHTALETLFNRRIDLVDEAGLRNPFLKREILATKQPVFPPS